ncbi:formate C-acetyltransferase [Clostridium beijerinckii]|jgi:formate C-acetyltransferase|uniref:Formate acetyltransferase n=4 Tax=Clostridium beijerinckii TaxID=1520 RepID=A0AAE2RKM9_CLOBE|nr:formate C-acetyltransferase [Clostridium beijerinckii]ABR33195.1 formate acetyltransferase [Clostridium beijerinckii NCIMB 8052]AIU04299.1 formate acetyltransferase [Clostridium beijerinckii ATCC 35702]MBF7807125.1 formate C-acetyltransferase [Clostridium beijerinckii]MBF7811907.1 formate C-acetyltransferase [Clostridium beijerinckii]NOW92992.1 formate C-acetyltransferase [Clostridium beijerinckii]
MFKQWEGFKNGTWQEDIDVRNFIQKNYKLYEGDGSFLEEKTERTSKVWGKAYALIVEEVKKGIIDVATDRVSGIDNYDPGYIDRDNEVIVGLQTDAPLKRIVNPFGGMRMVQSSLKEYGYELDPEINKNFSKYRKTHNEGVFDAYTKEIRAARSAGLLTGLPDAYGRGRIIGDYRRVALYGIDYLIEEKKKDLDNLNGDMLDELVRKREEVSMQIRALGEVKSMAAKYGIDISKPASNAKEAAQHLYFGYLAGIKENNGAATSFGRTSTFLDIYIERDLEAGLITEKEAQEIVDQLIIKLRLVRHLRTPEYNELFGGDPTWVTESIGGVGINGKPLVTKNSFRYLHTLINLGTSAEPNLTVLWSDKLPESFKKYCAEISIKTDSIQYENDEVMRPVYGDDYAIACCVSAMKVGKQMQFFGARANIAKSLLYAINGGVDELKGIKVVPGIEKFTDEEILNFDKVKANYFKVLEYVAKVYVDTMNIIHFMHDKYAYEASQMALHDTAVERLMAFGIAGLSVAIDSLSAIKYAKVRPIRNEEGITIDFEVEGDFPKYGNDDDRADDLGVELVTKFSGELKKHPLYRDAKHTLSALTITSNVMYGKKTGTTPDGRKKGEPLAPGANPMHGRDINGALASLNSVAKIPYNEICQDGVSNTFSIVPDALGKNEDQKITNLVAILDGYFTQGAHHLNVNVLNRQTLIDAMENPDKYPTLTIRVSGYAVNFSRLSKEQQLEVISRTFHESI